MAGTAAKDKPAAPTLDAAAYATAFAGTERKEAGPTYAQLAKAVHQLADVALPGMNEEGHSNLRTRTGISALIDMLEKANPSS